MVSKETPGKWDRARCTMRRRRNSLSRWSRGMIEGWRVRRRRRQ